MVEKKEPNEEIGKVRIAETLRAFQVAMQQPKVEEAKPVEAISLKPSTELEKTAEQVEDRDADVMRFVETLKQRKQRRPRGSSPVGSDDAAAEQILRLVFMVNSVYEEMDREVNYNTGHSAAMRVVEYLVSGFENQIHQNAIHYEDMVGPVVRSKGSGAETFGAVEAECPQCHKTFTRKVPGQICCSNECGIAHFPPPERKEPKFDDVFEKFIESQNNPNRVPPVDPIRGPGMPVSGLVR